MPRTIRADLQPARLQHLILAENGFYDVLNSKQLPAQFEHALADLRGNHMPSATVKQPQAIDVLQSLDLPRERRLADMQHLRGAREAMLGGNAMKGAKVKKVHVESLDWGGRGCASIGRPHIESIDSRN